MLLNSLIFVVGLGILYYGAEWLIKGAASLALSYGIRPLVVGLTVVALGTSMPEFLVNFFAALSGQDSLALGNIVGSNIANIGLILGLSAIVLPLAVGPAMLRKEYPIMLLVMILFWFIAMDGTISKWDGLLLIIGLIAFFVFLVLDARRHRAALTDVTSVETEEVKSPAWKKIVHIVGGVVMLAVGARMMVVSAVTIAETLGIEPVIVGLTVVAIGTSLPELAASVLSAVRGETDLSVGNVLGSNLLNVLFVIGLTAMIRPLQVEQAVISLHFPVMLGFCIVLLPFMWTRYRLSRYEGVVLFIGFFIYVFYLVSETI